MWGEDEGLVSSARSVGTSVLVEVLSVDCQNDKVVMRTGHNGCACGGISVASHRARE